MISDVCEVKWNEKHKRFVTAYGRAFRIDKNGNCVECKFHEQNGYRRSNGVNMHRLVYETFNSAIPKDLEIDHINDIRDDNYIKNLRLVTHKENCTKNSYCRRVSESHKGRESCMKGKKHTDESKRKMSEALKGILKGRSWFIGSDGKRHWQ